MSLEKTTVKHLGLILDGNRRWARENNLPTTEGHRQGAEVFKTISLAAFDQGIEYVSAYIFSTENWSRTQEEISYLMKLLIKAVEKYLKEFQQKGIRIVVLGCRERLDQSVIKAIERTQEATKDNKRGTLALCFNYGGHHEIVDAVKKLVKSGAEEKDITEASIEQNLYSPEIPAVDLLLRTSGEQRTSGFMLWRAAYSELFFTETLWPDFTTKELEEIINAYETRERRFGG